MGHLTNGYLYRCKGGIVLALCIDEGSHCRMRVLIPLCFRVKILEPHQIGKTHGGRGRIVGSHHTVIGTLHGRANAGLKGFILIIRRIVFRIGQLSDDAPENLFIADFRLGAGFRLRCLIAGDGKNYHQGKKTG